MRAGGQGAGSCVVAEIDGFRGIGDVAGRVAADRDPGSGGGRFMGEKGDIDQDLTTSGYVGLQGFEPEQRHAVR